jgi:hypothetical protein
MKNITETLLQVISFSIRWITESGYDFTLLVAAVCRQPSNPPGNGVLE